MLYSPFVVALSQSDASGQARGARKTSLCGYPKGKPNEGMRKRSKLAGGMVKTFPSIPSRKGHMDRTKIGQQAEVSLAGSPCPVCSTPLRLWGGNTECIDLDCTCGVGVQSKSNVDGRLRSNPQSKGGYLRWVARHGVGKLWFALVHNGEVTYRRAIDGRLTETVRYKPDHSMKLDAYLAQCRARGVEPRTQARIRFTWDN